MSQNNIFYNTNDTYVRLKDAYSDISPELNSDRVLSLLADKINDVELIDSIIRNSNILPKLMNTLKSTRKVKGGKSSKRKKTSKHRRKSRRTRKPTRKRKQFKGGVNNIVDSNFINVEESEPAIYPSRDAEILDLLARQNVRLDAIANKLLQNEVQGGNEALRREIRELGEKVVVRKIQDGIMLYLVKNFFYGSKYIIVSTFYYTTLPVRILLSQLLSVFSFWGLIAGLIMSSVYGSAITIPFIMVTLPAFIFPLILSFIIIYNKCSRVRIGMALGMDEILCFGGICILLYAIALGGIELNSYNSQLNNMVSTLKNSNIWKDMEQRTSGWWSQIEERVSQHVDETINNITNSTRYQQFSNFTKGINDTLTSLEVAVEKTQNAIQYVEDKLDRLNNMTAFKAGQAVGRSIEEAKEKVSEVISDVTDGFNGLRQLGKQWAEQSRQAIGYDRTGNIEEISGGDSKSRMPSHYLDFFLSVDIEGLKYHLKELKKNISQYKVFAKSPKVDAMVDLIIDRLQVIDRFSKILTHLRTMHLCNETKKILRVSDKDMMEFMEYVSRPTQETYSKAKNVIHAFKRKDKVRRRYKNIEKYIVASSRTKSIRKPTIKTRRGYRSRRDYRSRRGSKYKSRPRLRI